MRLFLGVDLSEQTIQNLTRLQDQLRGELPAKAFRWVRPELLHYTLMFLGSVDSGHLLDLKEAVEQVAVATRAGSLQLQGLGCFPSPRHPKVLWAGLKSPDTDLIKLMQDLERMCRTFQEKPEKSGPHPHVTLARANANPWAGLVEDVHRLLSERANDKFDTSPLKDLCIYESHLDSGPARYEILERIPLLAS